MLLIDFEDSVRNSHDSLKKNFWRRNSTYILCFFLISNQISRVKWISRGTLEKLWDNPIIVDPKNQSFLSIFPATINASHDENHVKRQHFKQCVLLNGFWKLLLSHSMSLLLSSQLRLFPIDKLIHCYCFPLFLFYEWIDFYGSL